MAKLLPDTEVNKLGWTFARGVAVGVIATSIIIYLLKNLKKKYE